MNEYFVFCWNPKNWSSRAIFVCLNEIDEDTLQQIKQLIELGPIISENWKWETDSGTLTGFKTNDNVHIKTNEKLGKLLLTWERLSDNGFECHSYLHDEECTCLPFQKNSFVYYIICSRFFPFRITLDTTNNVDIYESSCETVNLALVLWSRIAQQCITKYIYYIFVCI